MKIKSTVENYQEMAARFLSRILRKKVISFILFLNIIFLLNMGIIRSVSSSRFQQYPDEFHLKEGLEMMKEKNMDEYKPTARQLVTIKEDGRLGNLLLETANLYLIERKLNRTAVLLPNIYKKLSIILDEIPIAQLNQSTDCICYDCRTCICPTCITWKKGLVTNVWQSPNKYKKVDYLMLDYYDPLLILKHLDAIRTLFLPLLNKKAVDAADQYLVQLKRRKKLKNPTFIGVHVRRTDYLSWIKTQFKGTPVDENYFKYAFEQFRKKYEEPIFVVLSDDRKWCMTHLKDMGSDVVFPVLKTDLVEPAVQDFVLLVQTNHTIFDYGSFGFLSSLLAGGDTMYATGYSVKKHPILQALHKAAPWNWEHVDVSQGHIFY